VRVHVSGSGHMLRVVQWLLRMGWGIDSAPDKAALRRNGQLIRLRWRQREKPLRLFIYKITGSGRSAHERRIEITTTYQKGLTRAFGYEDVVLGIDPNRRVLVGIDARRIEHGGKTGNASSFIDSEALQKAASNRLTSLRRQSQIFRVEHQAYFKPERLAEYLVNTTDIHRGVYDGFGEFSGNQRVSNPSALNVPADRCAGVELVLVAPSIKRNKHGLGKRILAAFEQENAVKLKNLHLSQDQFLHLSKIRQEVGLKGEEYVLKSERKRLTRAGKKDLASRISWISQRRPFEGYDILSYDTNGRRRYIEVKTTVGNGKVFPITENEWRVANTMRNRYFIYRVTAIDTKPNTKRFQDPIALERLGILKRCPLAWIIEYQ
jgi:hypothetical protein